MTGDDIRKLLGGYSTGTLTPEEQQALFRAALDDQELFDALAREQALRDLLRDPAARAEVLSALDERPQPWWRRAEQWAMRPAVAGTMAACLMAVAGYAVWHARQARPSLAPVLTAENRPAAEPAPPQPAVPPPVAVPPRVATPSRIATQPPQSERTEPPPTPAPGNANQAYMSQAPSTLESQAAVRGGISQQDTAFAPRQQGVTVTAAAPVVPVPVLAPKPPEVQWSALRREADGSLSPVAADQIHAGDAIVLRLEPPADGQLSVLELVPSASVPRMAMEPTFVKQATPIDTPALTLDHPGAQMLLIRFSAQPAVAGGGPKSSTPAARARKASAAKDNTDNADASQPAQVISLLYK